MRHLQLAISAFKFRNVKEASGGPIARIVFRELKTSTDPCRFEVYSWLSNSSAIKKPQQSLYGAADGTGSSDILQEAIYKSISESLERFAFYYCTQRKSTLAGLHIDPSTSGMAAFPEIGTRGVRNAAFLEAVERWSVQAWWSGKLGSIRNFSSFGERQDVQIIELLTPFPRLSVVVLHLQQVSGVHCYAFAARSTLQQAVTAARVELGRNARILEKASSINIGLAAVEDLYEKRLLYFSREGVHDFLARVEESTYLKGVVSRPQVVFDSELVGPWSKFARVWRTILEPNFDTTSNEINYFLF